MAKNYRELKRFQPNEWEKDSNWMGKRLSFLWLVKDYRPDLYRELHLSDEKYDFYNLNIEGVMPIAQNDYHSVDRCMHDNIYRNIDSSEIVKEYNNLKKMIDENFKEFLLKKNCNKYDYFLMLINDGILKID
jgi:hypothetical protein